MTMTNVQELLNADSFIGWLERQDPNTEFQYSNIRDCVVARYLADHGFSVTVGGNRITIYDICEVDILIPDEIWAPAAGWGPAQVREYRAGRFGKALASTYGEVLKRVREFKVLEDA